MGFRLEPRTSTPAWLNGALSLGAIVAALVLCAGLIAGAFSEESVPQMPSRFILIVLVVSGAGIILLLLAKPIKKLMPGVQ